MRLDQRIEALPRSKVLRRNINERFQVEHDFAYGDAAIGRDAGTCKHDNLSCSSEGVSNFLKLAITLCGDLKDRHGVSRNGCKSITG